MILYIKFYHKLEPSHIIVSKNSQQNSFMLTKPSGQYSNFVQFT